MVVDRDRVRAVERIIGHKVPPPFSATLMEDCRCSTPAFAGELISLAAALAAEAAEASADAEAADARPTK